MTLLHNIPSQHLQHFCTTLLHNTPSQHLQHFSTTLLHDTSPQHSITTLLNTTSPRHFSTTLLYDTSPQHSFATLLDTTSPQTSPQHFPTTLFYKAPPVLKDWLVAPRCVTLAFRLGGIAAGPWLGLDSCHSLVSSRCLLSDCVDTSSCLIPWISLLVTDFYIILGATVWQRLQTLTLVDLLQLMNWCSTALASRPTTLHATPGPPRYLVFHQQLLTFFELKSRNLDTNKLESGRGPDLTEDPGPTRCNYSTIARSQVLRRAWCRLDTHGYTWYKGQHWQKQIVLPTKPDFTPRPKSIPSSQPLEHVPKNRLIVFHWNGGALSSARYNELLLWLQHQWVDIAIISETHWSYTAEWQTSHWNAIHSGKDPGQKDKASGLLFLVATRLCRLDQIVWREVEAGRLNCCIADYTYTLDLLISLAYTNICGAQPLHKNLAGNRFGLLKEIPNRNSLCVLGDFNCSLPSIPRLVGQAHFTTSTGTKLGPQHGDSSILSQLLLNDFQMVALNTWTPSLGATSYRPSGSSRIDYILVRHRDADTSAKQVGLLTDAPYLHTGAYHIPMITKCES